MERTIAASAAIRKLDQLQGKPRPCRRGEAASPGAQSGEVGLAAARMETGFPAKLVPALAGDRATSKEARVASALARFHFRRSRSRASIQRRRQPEFGKI